MTAKNNLITLKITTIANKSSIAIPMGNYNLENLELVKKTLKKGTPEEKKLLRDEINKLCPDISDSDYKCNSCLINKQLLDYAWELRKEDDWSAEFTCGDCNTLWIVNRWVEYKYDKKQ